MNPNFIKVKYLTGFKKKPEYLIRFKELNTFLYKIMFNWLVINSILIFLGVVGHNLMYYIASFVLVFGGMYMNNSPEKCPLFEKVTLRSFFHLSEETDNSEHNEILVRIFVLMCLYSTIFCNIIPWQHLLKKFIDYRWLTIIVYIYVLLIFSKCAEWMSYKMRNKILRTGFYMNIYSALITVFYFLNREFRLSLPGYITPFNLLDAILFIAIFIILPCKGLLAISSQKNKHWEFFGIFTTGLIFFLMTGITKKLFVEQKILIKLLII